jgi:hypothetical protein
VVGQGSSTERLLYAFSRAFLADPRGVPPLDEEARRVYALLQNQVEQFRRSRGAAVMKDYELAKMSLAELMQPFIQGLTPQERVAGLTPEQLVGALTPEQLAGALTPEQIAKAIEALPADVREQIKKRLQ